MAVSLPELTYRFPTQNDGPQSTSSPTIILDWNTDINENSFKGSNLETNVLLIQEDTSTILNISFESYTAASRRVTLNIDSALEPNKTYRVFLKNGIQSSDGRRSRNEYHWTFQTASGSVGALNLLHPPDSTIQATGPTLSWSSVSFSGSASGGTVSYKVWLSDRFDFGSLNFSTTTISLSALPNYSGFAVDGTTYYWRVQPYTTGATGNWSDVWSFYYGRALIADPTTRQYLPDATGFEIKKLGFKNGLSHLSAYPTISITFTSIPASNYSSYIQVLKKGVLPRNDDVSSYDETTLGGSWAQSGSTITFTPSEAISNNTRYEIRVLPEIYNTSHIELGEEYSFWFTGKYSPFYCSPRLIRSKFLGAEQKVPDDLINFYIHTASLEANARYWGYTNGFDYSGDSLLESTVRDSANLTSFGVLKWTEAAAAYTILKAILFEHLRDIGRTEKLGDSFVSLTKDFVTGIEKALDLIKQDLEQWENYLTPSHVPLTTSKGYLWSPLQMDYDWSIRDLEAQRDDGFC